MPSFPIVTATAALQASGTVVTNPYKTVAQAQSHGQQRPAVIRVISYYVQNETSNASNVSWADSLGATLVGPLNLPSQPSNWSERASAPAFLFETTRNSTTGADLLLNMTVATNCNIFVEYTLSFVPGRVAA